MLKDPEGVIAESIPRVSILFIMIEDFDKHTSKLCPADLLSFLNEKFTTLDAICAKHLVTKIETVSEEYVAAVGVKPEDVELDKRDGHSEILGRLIKAAAAILKLQTDEFYFKMGIHTGPIVAGVIGSKLPRFRLFGDTVNTSARFMQKCPARDLQFGTETKNELPAWVRTLPEHTIELKGKGKVAAYLLDGPHRRSRQRDATLALEDKEEEEEETDDDSYVEKTASFVKRELEEKERAQNARFEQILDELGDTRKDTKRGWRFWWSCGLLSPDFPPDLEEKWHQWFHENTICKKLDSRLDRQLMALLVLTACEMLFTVTMTNNFLAQDWHTQDGLGPIRLPLFLACRGVASTIILAWQQLARKGRWILSRPSEVQTLILISYLVIEVLMFVSYDCLTVVDCPLTVTGSLLNREKIFELKERHKRGSAVFSSIFCPIFLLFATQHQLLFKHTLWFILLCMCLMQLTQSTTWGENYLTFNLYFSKTGKVMLVLTTMINSTLAYTAELNSKARYKAAQSVEISHRRIRHILSTLMPPLVVEEIRDLPVFAAAPTHKYLTATIAQSDLVGFTKLAATLNPPQVVHCVSELFGSFDKLTDKHHVYKVETVGDAYIAGQADPPLTSKNWPVSVVLFGLEMVRETQRWAEKNGWSVDCRVGVAHGECIGGIVGTEMQRYHLFGDLLHVLEVLESTAPEGRVQISGACKDVVAAQMTKEGIPRQLCNFEKRRGDHLTTSKGDIIPWAEAGGFTYVVRSESTFRGWIGI